MGRGLARRRVAGIALSHESPPKENVWAATYGEGIAMQREDDQNSRQARSRLDLAGRLFRPHWRRFRSSRASSSQPGVILSRRRDEGSSESIRLPLDVLCGGMYRACSTWQYEVAAHLIEQHLGGERLGYLTGDQYAARLRSDAANAPTASGQNTRWRVVKSHEGDRSFARALANERGWRFMRIATCAKSSSH